MKKRIFAGIGTILGVAILLLLGLFVYESKHQFLDYEESVGTTLDAPRTEYAVTDWMSHLGYLETFNIQGQKIRYLDRGDRDGTPLLLVHGTPTNSRLWRKMIPGLVASGYRVIAPDQFGFGASQKSDEHIQLTIPKQSQRLVALMDHLEIQEFAIAGHDQGSLWVWETITQIPERISHLVVFNSIGYRDGFHPPAGFGTANIGTKFTGRAMGSKLLGRVFAYGAMIGGLQDTKQATMTMINGYLFPLLNNMNNTYYDFITHFDDVQQALPVYQQKFVDLDIPTTIIRGAHDKILVGTEQIPTLADSLNVQEQDIHILEDAAHFVQEERAEEIVDLINSFVK